MDAFDVLTAVATPAEFVLLSSLLQATAPDSTTRSAKAQMAAEGWIDKERLLTAQQRAKGFLKR
ncbi:MAG TPA: hypothetical protein VFY10_07510, partial [Dehalococcoidia bacterium]|nr:hypothetical protein [Dehalococcoidia bacterium]